MKPLRTLAFCLGAIALLAVQGQSQDKPDAKKEQPKPAGRFTPLVSPEVHSDRSVTFRLRAPKATDVKVSGEGGLGTKDLKRDDQGVWSLTTAPLAPELYGYGFVVDGLRIPDPSNSRLKPMRSPTTSILDIPGDPPLIHDVRDVPHGAVHLHQYRSKSLGGVLRRLRVYTPPGYENAQKGTAETSYPVLYLLHGAGDNEATWTELGRANLILDNLIADKKARPMVIVMTDGHAGSFGPGAFSRGISDYEKDLLGDVMPLVATNYRVKPGREHRAIIGLSMGGMQSMTIGLNHLDKFAYVGGMSSMIPDAEKSVAKALDDPQVNDKLKLFWVAIGKNDFLLKQMEQTEELLNRKKIKHTYLVTEGDHSWPVWRRYLASFAPLVFQGE